MRFFRKNLVLIIPALAALAVRGAAFFYWLDSPVRYYSHIVGLDMKANLQLGEWLYQGFSVFTLHKLMIAAVLFFNHGKHCVEAIILLQMFLGIILAVLTAWIALMLSGRRSHALISGCIAALYAPELIYECITLRESTMVFAAALSLAGILWCRKKHYSAGWLVLAGAFLTVPSLVRFSAFLWCCGGGAWIMLYCIRRDVRQARFTVKKMLFKAMLLVCGALLVFAPISIYHGFRAGTYLPFYVNSEYAFSLGGKIQPKSMNIAPPPAPNVPDYQSSSTAVDSLSLSGRNEVARTVEVKAKSYFGKFMAVFMPFEIANNTNYYFMKYKVFPSVYLLGPLLIIPLAVSGLLLLLLFSRRLTGRESLLFFYVAAFVIPLCIFLPLARYRLILLPVFAYAAPLPFIMFFAQFKNTDKFLFRRWLIPVLTGVVFYVSIPHNPALRGEDFVAYGKALVYKKEYPEAEEYFRAAIETDGQSVSAVINYVDVLLKNRKYKEALRAILPYYRNDPNDEGIALYCAVALLCNGDAVHAETVLSRLCEPQDTLARLNYYYNLGESRRLQNKTDAAIAAYRKALEFAGDDVKKKMLTEKINVLLCR